MRWAVALLVVALCLGTGAAQFGTGGPAGRHSSLTLTTLASAGLSASAWGGTNWDPGGRAAVPGGIRR